MHFSKPAGRAKVRESRAMQARLDLLLGLWTVLRMHQHQQVRRFYRTLYQAWGPQHWWPADSQLEVIVGAYLTQNTAWINVGRALTNLRAARALSVARLREISLARLQRLIRPSGYFRQKARRLKTFVAFLDRNYGGSLDVLFSQPTGELRKELLSLNGVGPETADSILLYAGNHPVFVVDAYTRRILDRHQILPQKADYEGIRQLFESALGPLSEQPKEKNQASPLESGFRGAAHPPSTMSTATRTALVQVYNEMHGLIVGVGKQYCKKAKALCDGCPLKPFLPPK